jgi:hypothetical protein
LLVVLLATPLVVGCASTRDQKEWNTTNPGEPTFTKKDKLKVSIPDEKDAPALVEEAEILFDAGDSNGALTKLLMAIDANGSLADDKRVEDLLIKLGCNRGDCAIRREVE